MFSSSLGWRFVLITRLQSTIAIWSATAFHFSNVTTALESHESCFYLLHIDAADDDDDHVDEERKCEVTRQRDHNIFCFLSNKRFVCLIESSNINSNSNKYLLWPTRALKMQFIFEKTMPNE